MIKKYTIKANLSNNKDINFKNKVENLKVKVENNENMFIYDLYLHVAIIIYKYQK